MSIPPPPPIGGNPLEDNSIPQPPKIDLPPQAEEVETVTVRETVVAPQVVQMPPKPTIDQFGNPISPKSRLAAALLAFFLGGLGIHRFYVGKIGTGVLMIFTLGGLGIWALIDFIVILSDHSVTKMDDC